MKWRCKNTGNVIELPDWEEVNMVGHDGYEKVEEEVVEEWHKAAKTKSKKEVTE